VITGKIVLIEYNGKHYEREIIRVILCNGHILFVVEGIDEVLSAENLIEVVR